ncbi:MAG TPA: GatB/YqeY domain-containing protein [Casimicrobiaceae bacterium]|nr:GatB/YqeY domain-containing protein [Casimicrobiaceae bacterium]
MALKARITEDMKAAMRARDTARLSTIRLLLAALKQKELDERVELTDADVVGIVDKMIKQRRESITQFDAGGRPELAAAEGAEIEVLQQYLPEQLSDAEIDRLIDAAIANASSMGPAAMGKVMGALKSQLAGRADLTQVAARVKARIAR